MKIEISNINIDSTSSKSLIDKIIRECDDAFKSPISRREIYEDLLTKYSSSACFIYAYYQKILGYAALYVNDTKEHNAYISMLGVKPEAQNLKIGTKLLKTCIEIAKIKGMQNIYLEVRKDNIKAFRFYQRNGFLKEIEKEDSYILKRNL